MLTARDPVLLCIADQLQDSGVAFRDPAEPARQVWMNDSLRKNSFTKVAIDDLNAIVKWSQFSNPGESSTRLRERGQQIWRICVRIEIGDAYDVPIFDQRLKRGPQQ